MAQLIEAPIHWKRFTSDAILAYVGKAGEPIVDMRNIPPIVRLCDGVTAGGHLVGDEISLEGVAIPQVISPLNGAVDIALSPMITLSNFNGILSDASADTHTATTVDFYSEPEKTTLLFTTGRLTTGDLTLIDLDGLYAFTDGQTVYFEATYEGSTGNTATSAVSSFVAAAPNPNGFIAKLLASDGAAYDGFGYSVSISGDGLTAIVGAYQSLAGSGSAYIFSKASGNWLEVSRIIVPNSSGDYMGHSVSISSSGYNVVIGSDRDNDSGPNSGSASIFG
jgi:hypothetical protein